MPSCGQTGNDLGSTHGGRDPSARTPQCGYITDELVDYAVDWLKVAAGSDFVAADEAVDHSPDHRADDGRDPEYPELSDGPAAYEHGRAGASRGIHRGGGDRGC